MGMKLRKYPVFSSSGKKYLVKITEPHFTSSVSVEVFVKGTGWFNREKWIRVRGGTTTFSAEWYCPNDWNYDYIEIAKHSVESYETKNEELLAKRKSDTEGKLRFEQWDGS
jgi:hypothetical protein